MVDSKRRAVLKELEEKLGIFFKDIDLLNQAFIHESYANERKEQKLVSNERLEFLGDSVLGLMVTEYIYALYPDVAEGELNRVRAAVVSRPTLAEKAAELGLGQYLLLSKGEILGGGRERSSLLANVYEALIGVIYLDQGIKASEKFVIGQLKEQIDLAKRYELFRDYKSILQELAQKDCHCCPHYEVIDEKGPDHCKTFFVQVLINDKAMGNGKGKSKKEAEQEAAHSALQILSPDIK